MIRGSQHLTNEIRDAAVTYCKATRTWQVQELYFAALECGGITSSRRNHYEVGGVYYCNKCTQEKLNRTGD